MRNGTVSSSYEGLVEAAGSLGKLSGILSYGKIDFDLFKSNIQILSPQLLTTVSVGKSS